jgi:hypothetical protein
MYSFKILENEKVSYIFVKMISELLDTFPNELASIDQSDFKKLLPLYFKKHFNAKIDFDNFELLFEDKKQITLTVIKYR